MNYEQIDGNKRILIDGLGGLSKNGTSPIVPDVEEETGFKTFTTPIPGKPGEVETRYVHVEVFRTHGSIKSCPRLEPEDVEFVDEDAKPAEKLTNLALSESGRAKVYGSSEAEASENEELRIKNEELEEEAEEVQNSGVQDSELQSDEVEEVKSEEDDLEPVENPEAEAVLEDATQKVFKWKRGGAYYDLIDPDTEESVLGDFEVEKKPKGKDGAEALGAELAEKFGISTGF